MTKQEAQRLLKPAVALLNKLCGKSKYRIKYTDDVPHSFYWEIYDHHNVELVLRHKRVNGYRSSDEVEVVILLGSVYGRRRRCVICKARTFKWGQKDLEKKLGEAIELVRSTVKSLEASDLAEEASEKAMRKGARKLKAAFKKRGLDLDPFGRTDTVVVRLNADNLQGLIDLLES